MGFAATDGLRVASRATWASQQHRVVDEIVAALHQEGVTHIFGVGGANIEDLYDAAAASRKVVAVLAKHEFSAATMADGYSRAGSGLGVVAATSGGASLNLVPGLGESLASRVPVLALVGQPPCAADGRGSFQDTSGQNGSLDALRLFAPVSVFCERIVDAADIGRVLQRAIAAARSGGPAVLLLPKDVQQSQIKYAEAAPQNAGIACTAAIPDPLLISRAIGTGTVTIIAGEQVARDDARHQLESLRAALGASAAAVPDAKDVLAEVTGAARLGVSGVMGHPGVADAVSASSVCLLIGTRLSATAAAGLELSRAGLRIISIGSRPPFPPCTHFHADNLRESLASLVRAVEQDRRDHSEVSARDALAAIPELSTPTCQEPGVRYRDAMAVLDDALGADVDIVVDAGNTGAAAIHYLPTRRDGRFIVALGMGGMGYSFGAGIGVAFARGHRTVVIAGDGSFFMHGMEIHTAVHYRLPITFVVFNNNAHAMCVTREQLFYGGGYTYNRFEKSRIGAGLAAMFPSLPAVDVDSTDGLYAALAAAHRTDGPSVISVDCSADEIPPFAPFLSHSTTS